MGGRAGVPASELSSTLVRYDVDQHVESITMETGERPPMSTIASYRAKFLPSGSRMR